MSSEDPLAPTAAEAKMANHQGAVIFVVDDEPGVLHALRRIFAQEGYQVHTFESAVAAREAIVARQPHVVISDNYMPELEGVVFLEQTHQAFPAIRTLLLTGGAIDAHIVDAMDRGGIDMLVRKPWDAKDLKQRVRELVERATSSV